jgi:predicted DCC family thiol-disulfide oxidoreductase YuxK
MPEESKVILLFDGVCNLCNGFVNFIISHDKKKIFLFAPIQSEAGKKILNDHRFSSNLASLVLIENDKILLRSEAGLRVLELLGGFWKLFLVLKILPLFIRNFLYDKIAEHRYKLYGKKESCRKPDKLTIDRFLK